jgi:ABC-type multidrug transport system ATPase subunit
MNKGHFLAVGSLDDLSHKLWPTTWVDVTLWKTAAETLVSKANEYRGVKQVEARSETLSVQLEGKGSIPEFVRHLAENGAAILKVNPRDYSLEDIYFTIQNGEAK